MSDQNNENRESISVNVDAQNVNVTDVKGDLNEGVKVEPKWTGGSFSPKTFRFRTICLFILTVGLIFVGCRFIGIHCHELWQTIIWAVILGISGVLWIWLILTILYYHWTVKYQLDHERLLIKRGLFYQTTDAILIAQINDIKLVQTLWDKLVNGGVGTLVIYSSDKVDSQAHLRGLDKPNEAFESIDLLRKDYVRRRGIKSFGTFDGSDDGGSSVGFFN